MNTEHSDTRANDLPIAESTQIEKIAKTPLKRLRLTLANRFGLHCNSNSPSIQTPPPKRNSSTPITLNKLDPQVYLDTQSNGFASRVVKYHEASEAKTRDIANKTYRRLGDFPIVNLDKSEINLNQKQANASKVSKIPIAPPINLVSASASARSTIFRTGKNYGDSYPIGPIGKIGPIEGRKPIRTSISQNEPIVPSTSNYDGGSARSSLEALKEISRKRIHCDDIDGEVNKKQRAENAQDECDSNSAQTPAGSKRTRDRTSPSYCSALNEVQKKRYRNNDILSSLSSSLMSTPKRSLLNIDTAPTKVIHLDRDEDQTKDTHELSTVDCTSAKQRSTESSRVGSSNSDLPLHRSMEQIKPVIKSVSDGHVPKPITSKAPKLTLFNKDYSKLPVSNERTSSIDDDDDYSVSFVKPKSKTSTLFSGSKNRDQKSKLQLMLSFLRGDESKDEVDSVQSSKVLDDKKSNEKDEPKAVVSSSPSVNLSTNTTVTFSTATTASVLNVPSDAIKTSAIEVKAPSKETTEIAKEPEKVPTPISSIHLVPVTSTPAIILPVSSAPQSEEKPPTPARTVTFNLSPVQKSIATSSLSQTTSTTSDSVPRLGGFCFSATTPSFTLPTVAKPIATATTENSPILQNLVENKKTTPTISFGLPQSTGNGSTLPSLGAPVFGSANALVKPATNTESSQSNQTPSAPPTFNFGIPATKPTLAANTSVGFGTLAASTTASSAPSLLGQSPPSMFTFGATANTTNPVPAPSIGFGSNVPKTSAPAFGFNSSAANVPPATTSLPTMNQSKPSFSFGNTANPSKPETSAFQFGNATSTKPPVLTFGSAATTTSATPLFGNINTANTNTTATTQSAFTFTANKPAIDTKPLQFGTQTTQSAGLGAFSSPAPAFGQTNSALPPPPPYGQTSTFGNVTNTAATTTSSTTNLFGNASGAQNTSIFGSNNTTPSALPKIENTFGIPSNQNSSTPVFGSSQNQSQNQNQIGAFGSSMNTPAFGSTGNNVFGNTPITQNQVQNQQPTFGTGSGLFSTPTTTQSNNNAFGSGSGVFAFGQNSTQGPANTTSPNQQSNIFGSPNTNTNAPFVFGQSNNNAAPPNQSPGMFGAKPADSLNANSALSAPPSFGGSSPAFNFNAAKPTGFSFNASNTPAANVPAFGTTSSPPQFGSTNGMGTSFSFNASNNSADSKPFAFGGPATAPAATPASFSFNAQTPTPAPNAFQFNAQQPAPANIFSIGPSGTNTTKTGRPMRTATRRIK